MKFLKTFFKAIAFYIYNSFITNIPFYTIRHLYLRYFLKIKIGKGTAVHMGCFFSGTSISIGSNSVINRDCYIDGRGNGVRIGNNVSISPEAYILALDHMAQSGNFETVTRKTIIDDYAWIGVRALILKGVHVKYGSIVGAGAVLTRDTEPMDIVAGVPARKIGKRTTDLTYTLNYFPLFNTDEVL